MIASPRATAAFATSALSLTARPLPSYSPTLSHLSRSLPRSTHSTSSPLLSRRSAFVTNSLLPAPPQSHRSHHMPLSTMTASKDAPGVLDTDERGGVLMAARTGAINVSCAPDLASFAEQILVIAVWADDDDDADYVLPAPVAAFDKDVAGGLISELVVDAEFKAKSGSTSEVARLSGAGPKRVVLYGLGKKGKGTKVLSSAATFAVQKGIDIKACSCVGLYVHDAETDHLAFVTEGAIVGAYVDERYKEKKNTSKVPTDLKIVGVAPGSPADNAIAKGRALGMGILTTKEVINAPANCLTPATLAIGAEMVAEECGMQIKVLGQAECEKLGMGSFLGVGRGSTDEPKFIHMTYTPKGPVHKKVCVVGKAVTFDTGGSNLKAGAGSMIELMKFDMGGSAVALGTAKAIGEMKPEGIEVHFIMPAVENMLSDRAIHPGDILKASNGKTIEVMNTDAEGRLCLADALVYAENLGDVDYIVDLATLTGAIVISLGNDVAGFWSPCDDMADLLLDSAKSVGEPLWRMPLVDEYAEQLKSKIADLRNIGTGRAAGSITAALFLREFVKMKKWAHIDIAGTVWAEKSGGATGYGVKTMVKFIETVSSSK